MRWGSCLGLGRRAENQFDSIALTSVSEIGINDWFVNMNIIGKDSRATLSSLFQKAQSKHLWTQLFSQAFIGSFKWTEVDRRGVATLISLG